MTGRKKWLPRVDASPTALHFPRGVNKGAMEVPHVTHLDFWPGLKVICPFAFFRKSELIPSERWTAENAIKL